MKISKVLYLTGAIVAFAAFGGCDDDDGELDNTGRSCVSEDGCFEGIAHEELAGAVVCMDRVDGGYCTHHCQTDADCCAVPGECTEGLPQVCAPFESTGQKFCFLSCEGVEEEDYCQVHAHRDFLCRSTGGGAQNRKVCVPEG